MVHILVVHSGVFGNTVFRIKCGKEITKITAKSTFSYCFRERCLFMKEFFSETYMLNNADERLKFKRIFQGAPVIVLFFEFCGLIKVSVTFNYMLCSFRW